MYLFAYRKRNTENSRARFLNRYVPRAERTSHNTVLMGPYDGVGGRRFIQEIRIIEFMMINGFPFGERESAYVSARSRLRVFERRARDAAFESIHLVQMGRKTSLRKKEKLNYRNNI